MKKVAVTYENGNVFPHFGHTKQFKVYTIKNEKIAEAQIVETNGSGHGALAGFLSELKVDTLICGGIGAGAQNALAQAGIRLYGGVSGRQMKLWRHCLRETLYLIQMFIVIIMGIMEKGITAGKINTSVQEMMPGVSEE